MESQVAKLLPVSAFDECEHFGRESDVLPEQPPLARERFNINIERPENATVGDNSTIVYGQMSQVCADLLMPLEENKDYQDPKALPVLAFDERKRFDRESGVLAEKRPVSRELININIERPDHVMVGDNNTFVYGETAGVSSCDHDLIKTGTHENYTITHTPGTSQAEEKSTNELKCDSLREGNDETNATDNILLHKQQQYNYSKRKKPRRKVRQPQEICITLRNKNRKGRENESETDHETFPSRCTIVEAEEDGSGYKATIRGEFVQVDIPENEKENSANKRDLSHVSSTEENSPSKTLTLNIESRFAQIGHGNKLSVIQQQACYPLNTKKQRQHKQARTSATLCPGSENAKPAKRLKKFDNDIMEKLHKRRDNGDWAKFEEITMKLLAKYTDRNKDIHISILLEQSVAANYQGDLEQAKALAQEALSLVKQASQPMVNVFCGRAYYCLSCVYKRTQELEKAFEYIELSEESLSETDSLQDKAFLAYEKGCVLQVAVGLCDDEATRKIQQQRAKQSFEQCIHLCSQMYEEGEKRFLNKHIFAMMKIAMLLLDCRTKAARYRQVSEENIVEAKEYLDKIECNQELWERIARSDIARVQFELAQADYFFRRASYRNAEEHGKRAVELARDGGFKTEVEPGLERLADIRERFEAQTSCVALHDSCGFAEEQVGRLTLGEELMSPDAI